MRRSIAVNDAESQSRIWDRFLTDRDRAVFAAGGYGKKYGFGLHPALLIIDVIYNFVGEKPEPILESIKTWRRSCGDDGWSAIRRIQPVLAAARAKRIPVIYTHNEARPDFADVGVRHFKNFRASERNTDTIGHRGTEIVEELAPQPGDFALVKNNASCFFGTPLMSYLVGLGVDTLLVVGCTTSGCVRATVLDGQAYNMRMIVVEDGVFDRGEASHAISLFDMQAKYADVVLSAQVIEYLERLAV
jgi:maleamate amidohydrolase